MRSSFIRLSSSLGIVLLLVALVIFSGSSVQATVAQQATMAASGMAGACPQGLAAQVAKTMMMPSAASMAATSSGSMAATMAATMAAGSASGMAATMAASGPICLVGEMSGTVEVPAGDPKGTGFAAITVDPASNSVTFDVVVSGITLPATAMHIHQAAAGQAGGVVVPAKQAPDASGMVTTTTSGVDPALINQIMTNPSGFYVNVHNAAFPGGALRGQLEPYNPSDYPAGGTSGMSGTEAPMMATGTPGM